MFLLFLFGVSNFFISDINTLIFKLLKISTYMKYFSNSYAICTNLNNDLDNVSRKRKFNEFNEAKETNEVKEKNESLSGIRFKSDNYLLINPNILLKPEVNSINSSKSNQPEQVSISNENIEKRINDFFDKTLRYLKTRNRLHNKVILLYFSEIMKLYESNINIINKKILKAKIEEVLKAIIQKSFILTGYYKEKYSFLLKEIYKISSKAFKNDIECDRIKNLYELLLDIKFNDIISKCKKAMIKNLKDNFTNTKDLKEMEKNIKKILTENLLIYSGTGFTNFLKIFFHDDEYFWIKLLKRRRYF